MHCLYPTFDCLILQVRPFERKGRQMPWYRASSHSFLSPDPSFFNLSVRPRRVYDHNNNVPLIFAPKHKNLILQTPRRHLTPCILCDMTYLFKSIIIRFCCHTSSLQTGNKNGDILQIMYSYYLFSSRWGFDGKLPGLSGMPCWHTLTFGEHLDKSSI